MTSAELFLETLKPDGKPERQLKQYEALNCAIPNPIVAYVSNGVVPGHSGIDLWGTHFLWEADQPGRTPYITEETKVCPDITRWRDYIKAPDIEANCQNGWEASIAAAEKIRSQGQLATIIWGTGIFEQIHFMLGFEDTLTAFLEYPDEMHELVDYIFEYRMTYLKLLCEKLHPDAIISHDDWGTKDSLFMQPDTWREFFKEPYRKIYSYMRSQGIIAIHHADSYLVPIIEDMAEIGIQAWQGVLPENNIPRLQEILNGKMTLIGGIGAKIDRSDVTEEEIRSYVKEVCETCCPGGHFVPCITYGAPGTVYKFVDPIIDSEIDKYNEVCHISGQNVLQQPRRIREEKPTETVKAETKAADNDDVLSRIASALEKGQKKKTVSLCEEALSEGIDAETILTKGLVAGMVKTGENFTAQRAFVPEMLMSAKCMNAATELLKSRLVGEAKKPIGKACIGTMKGDMHDIGKNLVKIMMEGNGLEVIDLGTDVSAEQFIETAKNENCDIIGCSALLTTTMGEMRRVVELAKEAGIRAQVKIMVGGSPISQGYCDEIGADIYTADAASAAKAAVEALANKTAC